MSVKRGKLIAVEGPDFSGKTTLLAKLYPKWPNSACLYREPGGGVLCEKIRELLLNAGLSRDELCDTARACLFFASRCQLMASKVEPALARGVDVFLDRYWMSTFVYNLWDDEDGVRGLPGVIRLCELFNLPQPDIWLYCCTDVDVILERWRTAKDLNDMDPKSEDRVIELHSRYKAAMSMLSAQKGQDVRYGNMGLEVTDERVYTLINVLSKSLPTK